MTKLVLCKIKTLVMETNNQMSSFFAGFCSFSHMLFKTLWFQREYLSTTHFDMTVRSMPFHPGKGQVFVPCEKKQNHF